MIVNKCGDCAKRFFMYGSGYKCGLLELGYKNINSKYKYPTSKYKKGISIALSHPACSEWIFDQEGKLRLVNDTDIG